MMVTTANPMPPITANDSSKSLPVKVEVTRIGPLPRKINAAFKAARVRTSLPIRSDDHISRSSRSDPRLRVTHQIADLRRPPLAFEAA